MPFITQKCPICQALALSEKEFQIGGSRIFRLKCGHIIQGEHLVSGKRQIENLESIDGKKLFKYQCEGVDFALASGVKCLIADEMRLGKWVQAMGTLAMNEEELLPFVAFVKQKNATQSQREVMRWLGADHIAQVITGARDMLLPGAKGYIMSYDLPRRFNGDLLPRLQELGIKTIILDECQQIKNPDSQRTRHIREIVKNFPHVLALSGTPIKNNAPEYFSILNILAPEIFPRLSQFLSYYCDTYYDRISGRYKTGGLADVERFQRRTKHFIIRRTREEVKDQTNFKVNEVTRRFIFNDLSKELEKQYESALEDFLQEYENSNKSFYDESNILAKISKLRYLTGLSKVDNAIDFAQEFLESTDRKLTIFVHHKDVGDIINLQMSGIMAEMGLELPVFMPNDAEAAFARQPNKRLAILSTLAHGEGSTIPTCSDFLVVERQWNPANEEQAECRFIHVDQKSDMVEGTYLIAVGTVDEMFSEIVEQKRENFAKTMGGKSIPWSQSSLISELAESLIRTKRERWSYK